MTDTLMTYLPSSLSRPFKIKSSDGILTKNKSNRTILIATDFSCLETYSKEAWRH